MFLLSYIVDLKYDFYNEENPMLHYNKAYNHLRIKKVIFTTKIKILYSLWSAQPI